MKLIFDRLFSFGWFKSLFLVILGLMVGCYASGFGYLCMDFPGSGSTECADMNFWPYFFMDVGMVIVFLPVVTVVYSLMKYSLKKWG